MERSTLVRRGAPVAVFAAVLGGIGLLAARQGAPAARREPLPLSAGYRSSGEAAGAPASSTSRTADAMYYPGPIVIPDRLLAGQPTEGPVHTVSGGATEDRIAALARALGVVGTVQSDGEGWTVGEGDRVLRVFRQAGHPWYLGPDKTRGIAVAEPAPATVTPQPDEPADTPVSSEPCREGEKCEEPVSSEPCEKDCTEPGCPPAPDGAEPYCAPRPEPTKPPQPTDEEARLTAQRVFDAAGLTDPKVTINDAWSGKEVVGAPVVGGLPTVGFETRVTVELGGRVQYANGMLGTTQLKDTYPLLAPRESVERGGYYGGPRIMSDVGAPCEAEPCPTPQPREAKTLRLGLMFMASYDGKEAFLAPAWLLSFEGSTWEEPVLALPDRYLAPPPTADDQPATDAPPPPDSGSGSSGSGGSVDGSTGAPAQK